MAIDKCHSAGKDTSGAFAFSTSFRPGDDLSASFNDSKPTGSGPNQEYSEFIQSKHAQIGNSCETCHDPHGAGGQPDHLKKPVNDLCLGCHSGTVKDMATHAPSAAAGATCATCHMPDGSHRFAKPSK